MAENRNTAGPPQYGFYPPANQGEQQYTNWNTQPQTQSYPADQPPPYQPPPYSQNPQYPPQQPYGYGPNQAQGAVAPGTIAAQQSRAAKRAAVLKRVMIIRIVIGIVSLIVTITCGVVAYYATK